MRVGTKSLVFGAHQFILHPYFVLLAWRKIYGVWPSWRTTFSVLIHDIGYWGCREMDGIEGTQHPRLGAKLAEHWLGEGEKSRVMFHSRSMAQQCDVEVSDLCLPDKLSIFEYPAWLYTTLIWMSGEYREYQTSMKLQGVPIPELVHHFRVKAYEWAYKSVTSVEMNRLERGFLATYRRSRSMINSRLNCELRLESVAGHRSSVRS